MAELSLIDKILLRKRAIIASRVTRDASNRSMTSSRIFVRSLAKSTIGKHSRHRSRFNFLVNLISGLIACSYHPKKPCLNLEHKGLDALPPAIF